MSAYKVTFVSDYFVLSTTVDVNNEDLVNPNSRGSVEDTVYEDQTIIDQANQCMIDWCGFAPQQYSFDVEIEEVSYA